MTAPAPNSPKVTMRWTTSTGNPLAKAWTSGLDNVSDREEATMAGGNDLTVKPPDADGTKAKLLA